MNIDFASFESWVASQPAIVTRHFNAENHPLTLYTGWQTVPEPDEGWVRYIWHRTFRKPYGSKITRQEVQGWISNWKQEHK